MSTALQVYALVEMFNNVFFTAILRVLLGLTISLNINTLLLVETQFLFGILNYIVLQT